jgi:penicillin V acylase-like amidase (Ntn superfamily)
MQKLKNILQFLLVAFLWTKAFGAVACTVFMANDGQNVWVGNNEDELQNKQYRIFYFPSRSNNFGYMVWSELAFGKPFYGLMHRFPQGGLNEHGLFMDYTAIDEIPIIKNAHKKNRKRQVLTDILKKCKTVAEALTFIEQFNLIKLNQAQLFIADASGDYATVTGAYVVRKTENSFALTNYCINDAHHQTCYRRDVATHYLNTKNSFQLSDITQILEKSSQKLPNNLISNYSMAVNLKTNTLYLYYQ